MPSSKGAPATVLVAPDKFKGSLTASEVAEQLALGLRSTGALVTCLPLADGGDGSVAAAIVAGFRSSTARVADAVGQLHSSEIAFDGTTAVVEVANTCGLAALPEGKRAALEASSLGLGQAVRAALDLRPRRVVLALGGSASTDGGSGLLSALGARFTDTGGRPVPPNGAGLTRIAAVDWSQLLDLSGVELIAASDVTNPLTGEDGAAAVFGPQKGATPAAVKTLDIGLRNLVDVLARAGRPDAVALSRQAGAGSAGGIGFAAAVLGATIVSGAELFLDLLGFDDHLPGVDAVVTGEGSLDEQTANGKLPAVVARRSRPLPVIAVAGRNRLTVPQWSRLRLEHVYSVSDYAGRDTSRSPALTAEILTHLGRVIAHSL